MRRVAALVVVLPLLAACAGCGVSEAGSNASCAGPYIDAHPPDTQYGGPPPTVHPGDDLTVYGHWFTSTCNDTNHNIQPLRALPPERLTLTLPGGGPVPLGTFTPGGKELGFAVTIHVPAHTPAGSARIRDEEHRVFRFVVDAG